MRASPKALLSGAAASVAGFWALLALAYWWQPARWADEAALEGFVGFKLPSTEPAMDLVAGLADPVPYALLSAAVIAAALLRRRPGRALAAATLLGGSALTSQLLKPLLAHPRPGGFLEADLIADAAYPSGHATASMALALAAVLVAPPAWRAAVATVGAAFAVGVSFSIVALGWHFPSDIVGGYLVATAWCLVAMAAIRGRRAAQARARRPVSLPPARAFAAVAAALALAALPLAPEVAEYAQRHTAFAAVAVAISAAAALLVASVAAATHARS